VYNHVHQYLAETGDGGFAAWQHALDVVESLHPAHVVAGHKDATRADDPATITDTRRYLDDGAELLASGPSRREFFGRMLERYPDRVNPTMIWLSARRLLQDGA
jgi:3-mercaptopyruvate sulfurtransferase SseA